MTRFVTACLCLLALAAAGCRAPAVDFPTIAPVRPADTQPAACYNADKLVQSRTLVYTDAQGRINRIGLDRDADGRAEKLIDLDLIPFGDCRHLVIILDGFSYETVRDYYEQGHLRLFHPPSRVVAPYPTMTDLCLEDVFNHIPCRGIESLYFDHRRNRLAGGVDEYLEGFNQPYNQFFHYRADLLMDGLSYVFPMPITRKEINELKRVFDRRQSREVIAYIVGSAGVSTVENAKGQRNVLAMVDRLVHQVVAETHGLTKVTLLADHGHSYTSAGRAPIEQCLKRHNWKLTDRLGGPRDVVFPKFGLITLASFATHRPAELASDLLDCPGVDIVSYVDGSGVVVLSPDGGQATITRQGDRYCYTPHKGDPLKLRGVLAGVPAGPDGFCTAQDLLEATANHEYPDPLYRLWRAHWGLVDNPPDVLVSLKNEYYTGKEDFERCVKVSSTHGSLNRSNSLTFIMSTAGALPPVLRTREIHQKLRALTGEPFPLKQ